MFTPQFDRSPLHQPFASAAPGPTHLIEAGGTCPGPVRLFSVCCSGGSLDPLFILFQSTHTPANKFDDRAHKMSPNPLLALASADALKSTSSGSGTSSQWQSSVATLSLMGGLVLPTS